MKLSEQWLRQWVNPTISTDELVQQFILAGLEVAECSPVSGTFNGVIVAKVLSAEQHPNADRLRVCKVTDGSDNTLNIVCGAQNARAGIKVALATVGAELPNNFKIKKSKLRGVDSEGMLCSASELGLSQNSEGIIELPEDAPLGMDVNQYLKLDDKTIDLDITPNRGDCLSVYGLAREVSALTITPLNMPVEVDIPTQTQRTIKVCVDSLAECPQYMGRVIENIHVPQASPIWLQEALRRSGLRSISPVVDVTNYVMLELGQPLHAFDLDKINGDIHVRMAHENEPITLLNNQSIKLQTNTLVIADESHALAIAGVMGGIDSSVTSETKHLFLESAYFSAVGIAGRARQYGLHTDSSFRFERGVSPELQERALDRATELLLEIVGGKAGPKVIVKQETHLPTKKNIFLHKNNIKKYLGISLADDEVQSLLMRLHFAVNPQSEGFEVTVPVFRFDISSEVDLIEEIARLYGYQNIPDHYPVSPLVQAQFSESKILTQQLRERMVDLGYTEAITYSFISEKIQQLFEPDVKPLQLLNPISAELAVMRTSLMPSLITTVVYNQNRQQERIRLFEMGRSYIRHQNDEIEQDYLLGGVITGSRYPENWASPKQAIDFFDIKADLVSLLEMTGKQERFKFVAGEHAALLPGQTAMIYFNEQCIGYIGKLHPRIEKALDCSGPVYLFEIKLSFLEEATLPKYQRLSKFPMIRRDIAILIAKEVTAETLLTTVKHTAGHLLIEALIFDVYAGKNIPNGKKSIALGLILQHADRTLQDEEVADLMTRVVKSLEEMFGAELRS